MKQDPQEPPPSPHAEVVQGMAQQAPQRGLWRFLQAVSLWLVVSSGARLFAFYCLGYRHYFTLSRSGETLVLNRSERLLGRDYRVSSSVYSVAALDELRFSRRGPSPLSTVGLVALSVGTVLGARFITEGVLAAGVSPLAIGWGACLFAAGVGLDFLLVSGWPGRRGVSAQLLLRARDHGWLLSAEQGDELETFVSGWKQAAAAQPPGQQPVEEQAQPASGT